MDLTPGRSMYVLSTRLRSRFEFEVWQALVDPGLSRGYATILGSGSVGKSLPDLWLSQTVDVHDTEERRGSCTPYKKGLSQSSQPL